MMSTSHVIISHATKGNLQKEKCNRFEKINQLIKEL